MIKDFRENWIELTLSESFILFVSIFILYFQKQLTIINFLGWVLISTLILIILSFSIGSFLESRGTLTGLFRKRRNL